MRSPLQVPIDRIAAGDEVDLGAGGWEVLDQNRIDLFADASGDHQWIHVDPARAAAEAATAGTIAHGMLTLSWASAQLQQLVAITGASQRINYGVEKVRFLEPVPAGCRVRAKARIHGGERRASGVFYRIAVEVEAEGADRPAMVGELLGLAVAESTPRL